MNALEQLLWSFERDDLEEISVISGSAPQASLVSGAAMTVTPEVWTEDALLRALVTFGGSRHVEELSATPRQWTARVAGLGLIAVSAIQTKKHVKAMFRMSRRDDHPSPPADLRRPAVHAPPPPPPPPAPPPPPRNPAPALPSVVVDPSLLEPPSPPPSSKASRPPPRRVDSPTQLVVRRPAPRTPPLFEAVQQGPSLELDVPPSGVARQGFAPPPPPAPPPPRAAPSLDLPPLPPLQPREPPPPPVAAPMPFVLPPLPPKPVTPPPPPAPSFETLLANARDAKASDLHIIAGRPPLYRIAGELRPNGPVITPEQVERMVLPRVPARLEKVLAEQGSCDFALADRTHGRFRVNVSKQQTGYKACLRLVSKELPTVESLRLPDGIAAAAHHHQGLIVFTGPTGHGKTTTMNAVVDLINRSSSHHIITVEDPVEHLHPKKTALMSQREVGTHTRSFAAALKGSLREDPDVIVVGELRDVETVRMAVAASETGHLVLGTMNTPSAARTIDRLVDLFPPGDQPQVRLTLAGGLRLIVSQRLVPGKDGKSMHAALEVLPGSVPLAALIRDNKTFQIPSLQQRGKGLGIIRLDDSLAKLVAEDRVTLEAAKAVCESPAELEAAIKAIKR